MDRSDVDKSVVCSIATKPSQFEPILQWSNEIRSKRIIPLLSIHPADSDCAEKVKITKGEGFKGIKLHPFYQEFDIDEGGCSICMSCSARKSARSHAHRVTISLSLGSGRLTRQRY